MYSNNSPTKHGQRDMIADHGVSLLFNSSGNGGNINSWGGKKSE